jgi:ribonuclease HI
VSKSKSTESATDENTAEPQPALREVDLFTDGACSGNPGPGGWAVILRDRKTKKELCQSGGESGSTNNRMELMAVIYGLKALKKSCRVNLFSDSKYVLQGLQEWVAGWKRNGWMRQEGRKKVPLKNVELWQELDQLTQLHRISYHHVRGHSGHPENERCDEMAVAASEQYR